MNDELRRRLEDWGESDAPAPDADFARRLDADLRSASYFRPAASTPIRRRSFLVRPAFVLGAIVALGLAVAVIASQWGDDQGDVLVFGDGAGATITIPGETSDAANIGSELPDGTVIEVSSDGFAVVDGIVLPGNSRAVVVDGHIELFDPPVPIATTPTPTNTPVPDPTVLPTGSPTPAPTTVVTAEPTNRPEPTPSSTSDRPPPSVVAVDPSPRETPPDSLPTPTPRPVLEPASPTIALAATNLGPARAVLTWSVDNGSEIAGWRVLVRRGDTIQTAAVLRKAGARELTVERPARGQVFYTVVALSGAEQELGRSNRVKVTAPPTDGGD